MKRLRLFDFAAGIFFVFLLVGCGSSNEEAENEDSSSTNETEESSSDEASLDEEFEEADSIALDFYKAYFEFNVPVLYEMLPSEQQDTFLEDGRIGNQPTILVRIEEEKEDLVDPEKFPEIKERYEGEISDLPSQEYPINFDEDRFRDFEQNEDYKMIRLASAYDETGEIFYYVSPWDTSGAYSSSFISVKQTGREWEVKVVSKDDVGIDPDRTEEKEELERIGEQIHPIETEGN